MCSLCAVMHCDANVHMSASWIQQKPVFHCCQNDVNAKRSLFVTIPGEALTALGYCRGFSLRCVFLFLRCIFVFVELIYLMISLFFSLVLCAAAGRSATARVLSGLTTCCWQAIRTAIWVTLVFVTLWSRCCLYPLVAHSLSSDLLQLSAS